MQYQQKSARQTCGSIMQSQPPHHSLVRNPAREVAHAVTCQVAGGLGLVGGTALPESVCNRGMQR